MINTLISNMKQEEMINSNQRKISRMKDVILKQSICTWVNISKDVAEEWISEQDKIEEFTQRKQDSIKEIK